MSKVLISEKRKHQDFNSREMSCSSKNGFSICYSDGVEILDSEDGFFVFQGFISNKDSLKTSLDLEADGNAVIFRELVESEVLNVLDSLDGCFNAFVVDNDGLKVFRDLFGSKPLYFSRKNGLVLCSKISPILDLNPEFRKVNEDVAIDYLGKGLVDHRRETFFENINRVKPRENFRYDGDSITITEGDYALSEGKDLRELVKEKIDCLKPDNKDSYCPTSGRIDSAITSHYLDEAENIHLTFDAGTKDDEYIESVSKYNDLDLEKISVSNKEIIEELKNSLEHQEEPTAFPSLPAQSILYKNIDQDSIVISGAGADELFYGYSWFLPFYLADKIRQKKFLETIKAIVKFRRELDADKLYTAKDLILDNGVTLCKDSSELINGEVSSRELNNLEQAKKEHIESFYLPHILRSIYKNSERYGIDVKPVYLSKELFNLSQDQEPDENFHKGLTKYSLRSAFEEELPEKLMYRREKTGFVDPKSNLYSKKVREEFERIFNSESFLDRDIIKSEDIRDYFELDMLPYSLAYRFYNYEIWMREFIEGSVE